MTPVTPDIAVSSVEIRIRARLQARRNIGSKGEPALATAYGYSAPQRASRSHRRGRKNIFCHILDQREAQPASIRPLRKTICERPLRLSQSKGFRLHEFVVMPDHFHALVTVGSEISIERAVQFIKGGFAFRAGRELGFLAPVWQKGFSEVRVPGSEAFQSIGEYIRQNPVRRHLVCAAADFQYSSAHPGYELDPASQGLKPISLARNERYG